MCGRFTLTRSSYEIADLFEISGVFADRSPGYNIAPSQKILTLIEDGTSRLELLQWGLIPHWTKEINTKYSMINARAESLEEKASYRNLLMSRHCIIIADGFYEWKKSGDKKIPFYIKLKSGEVFGFPGLWDLWSQKEGGEIIKSCTIITTEPNELMKRIHNRMPVILTGNKIREWLRFKEIGREKILSLLKPYPEKEMEAFPVSLYVNSPKNDLPECIKPVKIYKEDDLFK